jgi:hypothetical protein
MKQPKPPKPPKQKKPVPVKIKRPRVTGPRKKTGGKKTSGTNHPAPTGLPAFNTTFDFYLAPNVPWTNAIITSQPCHLDSEFEMATQHSHGSNPSFRWTHVMCIQENQQVQDTWPDNPANYVTCPAANAADQQPTPFLVVFVETVNRNTPQEYKRVFLQRQTPIWPSNDL